MTKDIIKLLSSVSLGGLSTSALIKVENGKMIINGVTDQQSVIYFTDMNVDLPDMTIPVFELQKFMKFLSPFKDGLSIRVDQPKSTAHISDDKFKSKFKIASPILFNKKIPKSKPTMTTESEVVLTIDQLSDISAAFSAIGSCEFIGFVPRNDAIDTIVGYSGEGIDKPTTNFMASQNSISCSMDSTGTLNKPCFTRSTIITSILNTNKHFKSAKLTFFEDMLSRTQTLDKYCRFTFEHENGTCEYYTKLKTT